MRINIKCTAADFARLVRKCASINGGYGTSCGGCVLDELCNTSGDRVYIEHVVDVELVKDGAADG